MKKHLKILLALIVLTLWACGSHAKLHAQLQMNANDIITSKLLTKIDPKSAPPDAFRLSTSSTAFQKGMFVDISFLSTINKKGQKQWQPYLFIREIDKNKLHKIVYRVNSFERAYSPQISPNGRYILFKLGGYGTMNGRYRIFIFDRKTHKVVAGPKDLTYPILTWSPNSAYFAYIRGGNIAGANSGDSLKLYSYDMKSSNSRFITDLPVISSMRWTPENTLLYCVKKSPENKRFEISASEIREANPHTGTSEAIIHKGTNPYPSPDGNFIAYLQLPEKILTSVSADDVKQEETTQNKAIISILDRQTGKTHSYPESAPSDGIGEWFWSLGSTRIYYLTSLTTSPHTAMRVNEINVSSGNVTTIGMLKANDFQKIPRLSIFPQIELMRESDESNFLYFKKEEDIGIDPPLYIQMHTIAAFNPSNGTVIVGAKIKNSLGIDWWNAPDNSPFTLTK